MATIDRLEVIQTLVMPVPVARVLAAFFESRDLAAWWQVSRSVTVPRPLGTYAVEWPATSFRDDVLGPLGGAFHGTVMDYRPSQGFFVADAYWQPPEGEPVGPMALEVTCRAVGDGRATQVTVRQSAEDEGPRWQRYFELTGHGWERALWDMRDHFAREAARAARDFNQP